MEGEYLSLKPSLGGAVAFAAAYFIVGFPLKLIGGALFRQPWSQKLLFYTIVPFYSPRSWDRSPVRAAGDFSFAGHDGANGLNARQRHHGFTLAFEQGNDFVFLRGVKLNVVYPAVHASTSRHRA